MKNDFEKKKCSGCGKIFVMTTNYAIDWVYKWPKSDKTIAKYFCSWKCYHEFLKEKEEHERGRASKREAQIWEY